MRNLRSKFSGQPAHYQSSEYQCVRALVEKWSRNRTAPLEVLDFGFGRGKFLDLFVTSGCRVTGVDANPEYVTEGRLKGYNCLTPEEFQALRGRSYDIIFLSHLIEHVEPHNLVELISELCERAAPNGKMIIISPVPGERFFHDFSHVRPYLPQSIRHALGQSGSPIVYGERNVLELSDIYFFKDPWRTRYWRSFYVKGSVLNRVTSVLNKLFDVLWRFSGGQVGTTASWLGVYDVSSKL